MKVTHLPSLKGKADLQRCIVEQGRRGRCVDGHYTLEAQPWRVWVVENGKIVRSYHI